MNEQASTIPEADVERIPEAWAPADPFEPARARGIPWLLAPLAALPAMLAPRRAGAYLANSSLFTAYLVHAVFALLSIGVICGTAMDVFRSNEPSPAAMWINPLEELHRAAAGAVLAFYSISDSWTDLSIAMLVGGIIEAAILVSAVLLIPLYAAGEGAKRTYVRCLKLLLWSTACQAPLFWAVLRAFCFIDTRFNWAAKDELQITCLGLLELWWITVLFRLGGRYGGPKEGPRWEAREPRCDECGYSLVLQPLDGRCPECNKPIRESMPEARRAPAFEEGRGLIGRTKGYFRTTWRAMYSKRFAKEVAVWSSQRAARNYAAITCTAIGVMTMVSFGFFFFFVEGGISPWGAHVTPFLIIPAFVVISAGPGVLAGVLSAVWVLLIGLFYSRFGFRDTADRAVILFYSSARLYLPAVLMHAGIWGAHLIVETCGPFSDLRVGPDQWISGELAVWMGMLTPAGVFLLLSSWSARHACKHALYASA